MHKCLVYGLKLRDSDEIRYVGQTKLTADQRLSAHRAAARHYDSPVYRWILKHGVSVEVVVLVKAATWNRSEIRMIKRLKADGHRLLNCTPGGDGLSGNKLTDETKAKMSRAHRSVVTDDLVRKIRQMKSSGVRVCEIGRQVGISHSMVSLIANRRIWKWVD